MAVNFIDYILLLLGFIFTFFVPGLYVVENFFPKLPIRIKFPLILLLSVILSSYLVYVISLLVGFSRYSILLSFAFFLPWLVTSGREIGLIFKKYFQNHKEALFLALFLFGLFFLSLYPAIFSEYKGYIVMASVNWQDTAMHQGIIQSLTQGNFPPQAPYYSGVPLSYYYFADFHSAIIATLFGHFLPKILVYDNPFFIFLFALSIYGLVYELTKKKSVALASSFCGSLFGSLLFVKFFNDLLSLEQELLIKSIPDLLASKTYSMEYDQLFQMANMADYFLQNRPMMIGLPSVVIVFLLTLYALKKKDLKIIFLVGLISGFLIKFQFFAVVVSAIIFLATVVFFFRKRNGKFLLKSTFIFLIILAFSYLVFSNHSVNNQSFLNLVKGNFSFGPWDNKKDLFWHLWFIFSNFGLPFLLTLSALIWSVVRIIRKEKVKKEFLLLICLSLTLFAIPYLVRFTIYKGDMFKFFYFMVVFMSIVSFWFLDLVIRKKVILKILFSLLIFISTFSSLLTLANSFLNKNMAYSLDELKAGLFVRENTPPQAVFITYPTVHSAVSEIGGRLRVLSYINWPYSHGYNTGQDNVFARLEDVESVYRKADDFNFTKTILKKYNAGYIYLGAEEKNKNPESEYFFDSNNSLKKIYENQSLKIYELK